MTGVIEAGRNIDQQVFQPKPEAWMLNRQETDLTLKRFFVRELLEQVKVKYWQGEGEVREISRPDEKGLPQKTGYELFTAFPFPMLLINNTIREGNHRLAIWSGTGLGKNNYFLRDEVHDYTPAICEMKTGLKVEVGKDSKLGIKLTVTDGPLLKSGLLVRPEPKPNYPGSFWFPLLEENHQSNIYKSDFFINTPPVSGNKFSEFKDILNRHYLHRIKTKNLPSEMRERAATHIVGMNYDKDFVMINARDTKNYLDRWKAVKYRY